MSSGSGLGLYGSNVQSWAVTNEGAISGNLYGVDLAAGGSVANKAGATIAGGYGQFYYGYRFAFAGAGVRMLGGAGTVTNAGDINGFSFGVELQAGGSVTNKTGGTISGEVHLAAGGSVAQP